MATPFPGARSNSHPDVSLAQIRFREVAQHSRGCSTGKDQRRFGGNSVDESQAPVPRGVFVIASRRSIASRTVWRHDRKVAAQLATSSFRKATNATASNRQSHRDSELACARPQKNSRCTSTNHSGSERIRNRRTRDNRDVLANARTNFAPLAGWLEHARCRNRQRHSRTGRAGPWRKNCSRNRQ